jgi:UDP-glucose 4-epimerase
MNFLVTGGAGYIGSCTANLLIDKGHNVTIVDNLSTGNRSLVPKKAKFYKINIQDKKILKLLKKERFDVVLHFAAYIQVEESVKNPIKYFINNYENTKRFLNYCREAKLKNIVFSSTAAVYGELKNFNVTAKENFELNPKNAYALSKLKVENFLINSKFFNYIILRYFNVAGADILFRSGQISKKSTHLIKKICQNSLKKRDIKIFGKNYPSPDGTAIRDYIHVSDLAEIHLKAAKYIVKNKKSNIFNCGYGKGYSVKKIIDTFNNISKDKVKYIYTKRRKGDIFKLVANNHRLIRILKWKPKYNSIKIILESHLKWEKKIMSK